MKYLFGASFIFLVCVSVTFAHSQKDEKKSFVSQKAALNEVQEASQDSEEGFTPVVVSGILTAIGMLAAVFFPLFGRKNKSWMKHHKLVAYIALGLMLIHASLALFEHFFE